MRIEHAQDGGGDGDDDLEYKFPIDAFHSDSWFFPKLLPTTGAGRMEDLRFRIGGCVFLRFSFGGFLRVHGVLGSLLNLETVEELAVALFAFAASTRHLRKEIHAIVHHVAGHVKIGCLVGRLSS